MSNGNYITTHLTVGLIKKICTFHHIEVLEETLKLN